MSYWRSRNCKMRLKVWTNIAANSRMTIRRIFVRLRERWRRILKWKWWLLNWFSLSQLGSNLLRSWRTSCKLGRQLPRRRIGNIIRPSRRRRKWTMLHQASQNDPRWISVSSITKPSRITTLLFWIDSTRPGTNDPSIDFIDIQSIYLSPFTSINLLVPNWASFASLCFPLCYLPPTHPFSKYNESLGGGLLDVLLVLGHTVAEFDVESSDIFEAGFHAVLFSGGHQLMLEGVDAGIEALGVQEDHELVVVHRLL